MTVIKRNGKIEKLSKKKIFNSISNANNSVEENVRLTQKDISEITENILNSLNMMRPEGCPDPIDIDVLENIIENNLMDYKGYDVAKRYIKYRYEKERVRNLNGLTEKIMGKNVQNQNANLDEFSFSGRMGEAASYITKDYALNHLISKKSKQNHINNEIYIHDLDHYALGDHNCLSIPFDKLLANGFNTRQTDVRPANSINTAFQLTAVIFQLQSLQQFGGVAATHLDWTMVPYVRLSFCKHYFDGWRFIDLMNGSKLRKEHKTELPISKDEIKELPIDSDWYNHEIPAYKYAMEKTIQELKQAVEGMYHNLNTLQSRSGGQLPFTSINYGTCTSTEGRMVIRALIEGCMEGVGKYHRTAIFPCGIFQSGRGINQRPGDPNYDLFQLALECTAKRIYPNYANIDWSGNAGYDPNNPCTFFSTMGCRTANGLDINQDDPKLAQLKDGRGNISPVTIILPTLAMEAHDKVYPSPIKENDYDPAKVIPEFMKLLDKKINEARDMLLERFDWQCSQPADSAKFMYENELMYGYKKEEGIKSALKHGTIVIGQLGLAEALNILIGCDQTTKEGMQLAVEIETLFKTKCAKFKKDYKLNFGVYYTPAENLCYTALKKFREKYGTIPNVSDHDFFTNSIHVPVWNKMNAFQKIDIESQLTGYSNAGCITYVELDGDASKNTKALEELVLYAMEKDIPYFAINVPINDCGDCGYSDPKITDTCPMCGSTNIMKLRRVTGYLTGNYQSAFNYGKQKEVENRVKHTGIEIQEEA